jgi:hypothetical protein
MKTSSQSPRASRSKANDDDDNNNDDNKPTTVQKQQQPKQKCKKKSGAAVASVRSRRLSGDGVTRAGQACCE